MQENLTGSCASHNQQRRDSQEDRHSNRHSSAAAWSKSERYGDGTKLEGSALICVLQSNSTEEVSVELAVKGLGSLDLLDAK
jgi:hypothetical protein